MNILGKDIYNAQYRILDHRVFVNGEVEGFVNNFETQRGEAEVASLFKVTETVGTLKYELSDKCINLGSEHLSKISTELTDLLGKVENLLENVLQNPQQVSSAATLEAQALRAKRKEDFELELKHNYQRVDDSFAIKEEEISELYSDLQLKLNIPK